MQQLAVIYQKTKEWKKAVNVAEKLAKIVPKEDNIELAQYYCEYVRTLTADSKENPQDILRQALQVAPSCVRASMLLADLSVQQQDYKSAVEILENVLNQNPDYVSEILPQLKTCYQKLEQLDNFELFLIRVTQEHKNSSVELALADLIAEKDGRVAAQTKVYQQLTRNPSMFLFHRFIQYQIDEAEDGRGKESLTLLHKLVGERIKQSFDYRCVNCGYQSHKLIRCCPSCRQWEKIKPSTGTEYQ